MTVKAAQCDGFGITIIALEPNPILLVILSCFVLVLKYNPFPRTFVLLFRPASHCVIGSLVMRGVRLS